MTKRKAIQRQAGVVAMTLMIGVGSSIAQQAGTAAFGLENPLFSASTLPFQAPPFDRIHDADFQPAIEAGMELRLKEILAIAENPAPPTFENTIVAMEKSGQLYRRVMAAFGGVTQANNNPILQKVQAEEARKLATNEDAIYLNAKLFSRVSAIYQQRDALKLDAEAKRLVEVVYQRFVRAGANLSEADKAKLKLLNQEESKLSNDFRTELLAGDQGVGICHHGQGRAGGILGRANRGGGSGSQGQRPAGLCDPSAEHDAAAVAGAVKHTGHPAGALRKRLDPYRA